MQSCRRDGENSSKSGIPTFCPSRPRSGNSPKYFPRGNSRCMFAFQKLCNYSHMPSFLSSFANLLLLGSVFDLTFKMLSTKMPKSGSIHPFICKNVPTLHLFLPFFCHSYLLFYPLPLSCPLFSSPSLPLAFDQS